MLGSIASAKSMREPLVRGASSVKSSLGDSGEKLGSMALVFKTKAAAAAHTAEAALKHGAQTVKRSAQALESAFKHGVGSAKERVDGLRKLGLSEGWLFASQEETPELAQLVQMGFSRRAAVRALEAAENDVSLAAIFLCEAVARQRKPGSRLQRDKWEDLGVHAHHLAQLVTLQEDFDLQQGLVRSMHAYAMEQLEDLTLAQLLHDTATEAKASSEPARPADSHFLPSVGTWLLPLPLRLKEAGGSSASSTIIQNHRIEPDSHAEQPLEASSCSVEAAKEADATPVCRASRCGA
eukprot:TRINITY_DN88394_c0_g1_i1.p1 TRINITY_DN88394_c0_g1~~TRINITY_DN88394_c0_g1_i1.p1  ORF type:complete len:295 (+),score=80.21 TRINITY_DN88394_c0_g1_i1:49-933(+)